MSFTRLFLILGLCSLSCCLLGQPFAADSLSSLQRESLLLEALEAQAAKVEAEILRVREQTGKRKVKLTGKGSGRNLLMRTTLKARKNGKVEELTTYYLPYARINGRGSSLTGTQLKLKRRDGEIWHATWMYRLEAEPVGYRELAAYEVMFVRGRYLSVKGIEGSGRILWEKFFWLG